MSEFFYYPLGIWATKRPSRNSAVAFARKHSMQYAFQWVGVGSFVSNQKPPCSKEIMLLMGKENEKQV
mgnify:CR=1 FL=1